MSRNHQDNGGVDEKGGVDSVSSVRVVERALLGQQLLGHDLKSTRSNGRNVPGNPFVPHVLAHVCTVDSYCRHVMLPKEQAMMVPQSRLLEEDEWRNLGVQQSRGWQHYAIHRCVSTYGTWLTVPCIV